MILSSYNQQPEDNKPDSGKPYIKDAISAGAAVVNTALNWVLIFGKRTPLRI